ncbi:hypothetical protein [Arthrobacter sp.]|uniref:hypothetical protein n=1 Tax=Arthrobacter sp. TaxID=1667 RepID=UPI003A91FFD5
MTTNRAFLPLTATTDSGARRPARANPLLRVLRAIGGFYRVNWQRAAAQEYEYVRLRDDAVRKYTAASGGRM